jgi:hypothetical protein
VPERPPVECWQPIQSGSERAFDFMAARARRGIHLVLGERLALGYRFHISSSREQAIPTAVKTPC